jgi:H+/Cl- antiporter ClcA
MVDTKDMTFMRKPVVETSVLFVSVLKWFSLASAVGLIVGASTAGFLWVLQWSTGQVGQLAFSWALLPIGLFLSALIIQKLAPDAKGHGTEKVIEAIHQRGSVIAAPVVPVKLVATVITLATGGSAGKEGPCAQIGAGLASILSGILRFDEVDRKKLVICGVSAGFSTVFGTPVAGALFGVEVLAIGQLQYAVLFPSFVAGIVGYQVSAGLGTTYFHQPIVFNPTFSELFFLKVVLAGAVFGLVSFAFIEVVRFTEGASARLRWWQPAKGLLGGVLLLFVTLLLGGRYLGLGLSTIEGTLNGTTAGVWYDPLVKMFATGVTLSFGGSGGIVTPIFFVGTTTGSFLGPYFGLNPSTGAALGMVALLAGCANTPIAASIMAIELFGPSLSPYAAIACIVSFLMVGHRSVYPSQILAMMKSASLHTEMGKALDETAQTEYTSRPASVLEKGGTMITTLRRHRRKRGR